MENKHTSSQKEHAKLQYLQLIHRFGDKILVNKWMKCIQQRKHRKYIHLVIFLVAAVVLISIELTAHSVIF